MDIRKYIKEYTTQLVKEMSGTGTGAGFAPGVSNPQIATTKAFKKKVSENASETTLKVGDKVEYENQEWEIINFLTNGTVRLKSLKGLPSTNVMPDKIKMIKTEDAPQLAGGKIKNNYNVSHFGFTNAPSIPNRKSKAMDYKQLWKEYKINKPGPDNYIVAKLRPNTLEKFEKLMATDTKFYDEVYDIIFFTGEDDDENYNVWDGGNESRYAYIQGAFDEKDRNPEY
jgi:hypothetical protein